MAFLSKTKCLLVFRCPVYSTVINVLNRYGRGFPNEKVLTGIGAGAMGIPHGSVQT